MSMNRGALYVNGGELARLLYALTILWGGLIILWVGKFMFWGALYKVKAAKIKIVEVL